jgi:hypothetical protein
MTCSNSELISQSMSLFFKIFGRTPCPGDRPTAKASTYTRQHKHRKITALLLSKYYARLKCYLCFVWMRSIMEEQSLRTIFGPLKEEGTGQQRKLQNEELQNL